MTDASDRLSDYHYAILAALDRGENPAIFPLARKKLRRLELIAPADRRASRTKLVAEILLIGLLLATAIALVWAAQRWP